MTNLQFKTALTRIIVILRSAVYSLSHGERELGINLSKTTNRVRGLRGFKIGSCVLSFIWILTFGFTAVAQERIARIDFEDASVINVVQALARSAGMDLVLSGDQSTIQNKRSTVHLKNISIEDAIDSILRTNGLSYERKGNAILVSTLPQDLTNTAYKGRAEPIDLKYINASKAKALLSKIMASLVVEAGERANSLVIKGKESEIAEAKELLSRIDRLTPQILIESKVIEISQSDSMKLGLSYGNGTFRFTTDKNTRKTSLADNITTTLNALVADGKANVVASPRIATLDNQEALINIGNRIPYAVPVTSGTNSVQWSVEYIDAGVKLKITPQLGQEGYITTFIQPEVSSVSEWRTTAAGDFPVISTRNASATVRVKEGETIVIGGLMSESDRENITRVPILGYLPVLGLLFQNKNVEKAKTEVVFLITPRII